MSSLESGEICYLASNGMKIFFFPPNLRISVPGTSRSDESELSSRAPQFFFSLWEFAHLYTKFLQMETWDLWTNAWCFKEFQK